MMEPQRGVTTARDIRLQYTGYIIFAAKLIGVATGLIFQFMLGRAIAADSPEYAIWGNINTVLPYFTLLAGVSNPAAYLPFYLIVSILIIEQYLIGLFEPCLQARTPQSVGYGLILQQVFRVIIGYVVIIQLGQPLLGAVVSTIIALSVQAVYYFKLFASELKQRVQWGYVKEWFKGSVLIIYSVVGGVIANFVFIMLFYYGGFSSMDIYYAALQIATVITHAGFLSFALYPKLLTDRRSEDVTASMKTVLMFALPMAVGVISLSRSYIILLRPGTAMG